MRPVWFEDGALKLIDQTLLPGQSVVKSYTDWREVIEAIQTMVVRGAPAIGVAAGYAVVLAAQEYDGLPQDAFTEKMEQAISAIAAARPTAVNLSWAAARMRRALGGGAEGLLAEAHAIRDEDAAMCRAIGKNGAALLPENGGVLTHCNAGALATAEYGTALGVIRAAVAGGKTVRVYADETRPLLQGARLTAYELMQDGIDVTLITDNMAGWMMRQGKIDAVVVGADRIAANGDTANKIGTYSLSVLARAHDIPLYIAAPTSTIDFAIADGSGIVVEERSAEEVWHVQGVATAPEGVKTRNPAFDVTPAENITAIITEQGVLTPPYGPAIAALKKTAAGS